MVSSAYEVFNDNAQAYHDKFMEVDTYDGSIRKFCESLPGKHILELGCGPGNVTKRMLDHDPEFRVLATDIAPNMLALAKAVNPQIETATLDAKDISTLESQYDGIMCAFTLPYLNKEEAVQFIRVVSRKLNDGGVLYLSTMEDDNEKSGPRKSGSGLYTLVQNFHECAYLTEAFVSSGFDVILTERHVYEEDDGRVTTDLILIGKMH